MKSKDFLNEKWSQKYKKSINCSNPKGFSQRAHCAGRKKNESVELDEIDRRGFLKGLGAAALAGAGGAAMAGDLERDIGPLPIMATIRVQLRNGEIITRKIDLGHEYDYRLDDAKKDIEKMLDAKGVKNYTIHLDRYRDNEAYLDREQMKPQSKTDKNDYMDRKPYQPKGGSGSYVDNTPARASGKHNYMDPANYEESLQEYGDTARGQKQLTRVHKRAVDRLIKADDKNKSEPDVNKRDLKTVRKNAATADRAWERMTDKDLDEAIPLNVLRSKAGSGVKDEVSSRLKQNGPMGRDTNKAKQNNKPVEKGVAEGSAGAKYKIKSIGKDKNGDYYISPNTGKKVYKNAKVGDHETPRGEVKPKVTENNDSDEELFSVSQTPPRTAQALYHWSRMDPNRYSFRAIAEFALSNRLTLKQALQVTSRFDEYNEEMQDEYGVDDDQMSDLFGAYEEVCDAWNTDPTGDTSTEDSWEKLREADAELAEPPERPRKQQTKTKPKSKLDPNMFGPKLDQPLAKTDPLDDLKRKAGVGGDKPKVNIKKASQADTLSKTAGIGSDDMADMLSRMRNIEIDRDLEAYPEPEPPETLPSVEVNTANLPAVAGQALQAAGVQNPDFHQVANLPGNMADQIRQLGKSLFGSLTMTPTKRIHVVANLGGQGPNSSAEVNAVAGFLKDHGKDLGPGDIDFENVMPGYKAQTHMFSAAGIRWMLVKDFAGQYIYCWPEEDSHDAVDVIGQDTDIKRLK
jgi:hypothetical protein